MAQLLTIFDVFWQLLLFFIDVAFMIAKAAFASPFLPFTLSGLAIIIFRVMLSNS